MKKIMIVMIGLMLVSVVSASWLQQISEEQFLNLNRQQIINNLNIQCGNPYVQENKVVYPCQINTIVEDDDEYWIVREGFYPNLNYQLVKYCLDNYQPSQCKNFLVNNAEQENVTINGNEYTIDPVQYQIIDQAIQIIGDIEQLQQSIIDDNLLNLIQQQGGVTIPQIQ